MTEAPATLSPMTLQEFVHLYETEGPFELVQGERIPLMANHFAHDRSANKLAYEINTAAVPRKLGWAFVEASFVKTFEENTSWVKGSRQPDVMFINAETLQRFQQSFPAYGSPMVLIPQIVVEIISDHDKQIDLDRKIAGYLEDGVLLIWVVNPELRTVTVYQQGSKQAALLSEEDALSGGDVLPDFSMTVSDIFKI